MRKCRSKRPVSVGDDRPGFSRMKKKAGEPGCDDFIRLLEQQVAHMKQTRAQFAQSKIAPPAYEDAMIRSIKSLQSCVDGIRHTFVPLTIPECLQIPRNPPKWVMLSDSEKSQFVKIASDNDFQQKELLSRFRKPANRMGSVQKTAQVLVKRQATVKDDNSWCQECLIALSYTSKLRVPIKPPDKAQKSLVKRIESWTKETDTNLPYDGESAVLFLLDVFDENGPLSQGFKCKSITQEIGEIGMALNEVAQGVPVSVCIGATRPFVADLHRDVVMKSMEKNVAEIRKALDEAIDLMDDVSLADFGSEGPINVVVSEALKDCREFQGVERLASKMQEAALAADDAVGGSKTEAAKMIAAAIISEKLNWFPGHFVYAAGWCSDSMYERFTYMGMYIHAFDLIVNVVPDFG